MKNPRPVFDSLPLEANDLKKDQKLFQTIFETGPLGMIMADTDFVCFKVNKMFCAMMGYTEQEIIGRSFKDMTHPDDVAEWAGNIRKIFSGEMDIYKANKRYIRKDKSILWGSLTATALKNEQSDFVGYLSFIEDITVRKAMEASLIDSEERYKRIADTLTDYIYTVTFENDMPIRTVHGAGCFMVTGYMNSDFAKDRLLWITMVHPEDRTKVESFFRSIVTKPIAAPIEHRIIKKDGSIRWVRNTPVFHFNANGHLESYDGVVQDITERKFIEEKLLKERNRLSTASKAGKIALWECDIVSGSLIWSDIVDEMLGYDAGAFPRVISAWQESLHPDDKTQVLDALHSHIANNVPYEVEYRIKRKDGSYVWWHDLGNAKHKSSGIVAKMSGACTDVSERRRAETALLESEERYRTLFETSIDGIAVTDMAGRFLDCNKAFLTLVGYDKVFDLRSLSLEEITLPACLALDRKTFREHILVNGFCAPYEKEFIRKNGERIPVSYVAWIKMEDDGRPSEIWCLVRDITEKRKMDFEMQKSQHLESLSVLAGGIAHDFNNLLGGIFGYIDIAREFVQSPDKTIEFLDKALKSLDRAKDLSQRLLTFSKGGGPVKHLVSIGEIIRDTATLSFAGKNVRPRLHIAPDLYFCEADSSQIGRVLSNLFVNAHQAMPDGGIISIFAENTVIAAGSLLPLAPGFYVKVKIRDKGIGIAPEYLAKIFDPFFSTKKSGTGLGLTICQSIIKKHDGRIDVASQPGKGTEFSVYLPASPDKKPDIIKGSTKSVQGKGRVLVMDDEDFVLDVTTQMLTKLGYKPVTAQHGNDAITAFKKALDRKTPFDIVILDLTVPAGLGGVKALQKIRELQPDVIAIASSGYSNDPVMEDPHQFGFWGVLKKPYVTSELSAILHKALTL